MRDTTYREPYRIRVIDKPTPEIEHPRHAIVRVGVCPLAAQVSLADGNC